MRWPSDRAPVLTRLQFMVALADTDFFNMTAPAFLQWAGRGSIELWDRLGVPIPALVERGLGIVVRRAELDFVAEGHLSDRVTMITRMLKLGTSSLELGHQFVRDSDQVELANLTQTAVFVSMSERRSQPIPDDLRSALMALADGCAPEPINSEMPLPQALPKARS